VRSRSGAVALFVLAGATIARFAGATSPGPQPGSAGVPAGGGFPAEPTCISCHDSQPLNPDPKGKVELSGVPDRYTPGARYPLTFTISDPQARRWGFQLTAVALPSHAGAGELVATDPATQVVDGDAGRKYVEHSYDGTAPDQAGSARWTFEWVAPTKPAGDVAFFAAGNAANLDGSKEGDRIYSPSPKPLAISRAPEGP
jgi:hypothetical protein